MLHRKFKMNFWWFFVVVVVLKFVECDDMSFDTQMNSGGGQELFSITGRILRGSEEVDYENTKILVDDGKFVGQIKADGSFSISNVPSNSYVVEVSSPKTYFEPVRVDITSKGKIRARRLNLLQPNDVKALKYPINFEAKGMPNYFNKREQFRILDILTSPMVLMMVVPLLLVVVLPKLVNQDPELQRELQQSPILQPNQNMPDITEMAYNFLGGSKRPANTGRQQQQRRVNN